MSDVYDSVLHAVQGWAAPSECPSAPPDFRVFTAARAALKFKKEFEFELGRTLSQIVTVEYQILRTGTANDLDKETSDAMTEARTTMQRVHSNLTTDRFQQRM